MDQADDTHCREGHAGRIRVGERDRAAARVPIPGVPMSDDVSKVLDSLAFRTDPFETLYLNETRLHEQFVARLGAVESFLRSVNTEGKVGADLVVQLGGSRGTAK